MLRPYQKCVINGDVVVLAANEISLINALATVRINQRRTDVAEDIACRMLEIVVGEDFVRELDPGRRDELCAEWGRKLQGYYQALRRRDHLKQRPAAEQAFRAVQQSMSEDQELSVLSYRFA